MNSPAEAELSELVDASRNLPNATVDLGRVQLDTSELCAILRRLTPHAPTKGTLGDAKAHYLLAGSGFNAEQVLSDIQQIRQLTAVSKRRAAAAMKMPGVSAKSDGVSSAETPSAKAPKPAVEYSNVVDGVDALVTSSMRDFENKISLELSGDWSRRKDQIYALLGVSPVGAVETPDETLQRTLSQPSKRPGSVSLGAELLGDPMPLPDGRSDRQAAAAWTRVQDFGLVVTRYNEATIKNKPFDLIRHLSAVAKRHSPGPTLNQSLVDMWDLIALSGDAKAYLEEQYRAYIDAEIAANRTEARVGGVPSAYAKVRAFVQIQHFSGGVWDSRLALVNKTPIWAQLWYLVRAGYLKDALQVVLERNDIFELMGSTFASVFKAWVQSSTHTLAPHYVELVHSEYAQALRGQGDDQPADPFKLALYKVIGRCDLQRRSLPDVVTTTEDWLWLQLALVRPTATAEFGTDRYDLGELQRFVLEVGKDHFGDTGKWFGVLMLVGLYGHALQALINDGGLWTEQCAVHYAICLVEKLGASFDSEFDYEKTLGHYTRHFRQVLPVLAVDYLVLINKVSSKGACEALQELVLETRQFSELLGDVNTVTDKSYPGAIELRMDLLGLQDKRAYLKAIAHAAAAKADADGRTLDSILLYRLSEDPDRVLTMVNFALGQVLATVQIGQPVAAAPSLLPAESAGFAASGDPLALARNLMRLQEVASNDGKATAVTRVRPESRNTCLILLAIADAYNMLANGDYDRCLDRINETGLIVLQPDAEVGQIRELAQQFTRYDESISRNIPGVLLAAMTSCIRRTDELRRSGNPAAASLEQQYSRLASNCMVYAGLIQYRMPRDIYAHITQLEASLGV